MIVIDTHIWVWWVHGERLSAAQLERLSGFEEQGLGVSIFSCWEVAKLVQLGRLKLQRPVADWFDHALAYPGVQLLGLTPDIIVDSTNLPGSFHRDPADELIVATARVRRCPLATADEKILDYQSVETLDFRVPRR